MKVWVKVKNSSQTILSVDCRPTVGSLSAVSRPTVGRQTSYSLLVFPQFFSFSKLTLIKKCFLFLCTKYS